MAANVNPKVVNSIAGGLVGGTLLEDDRDLLGTSLGVAIGSLTGSMLDVQLDTPDKIISKEIKKNLKQVPIVTEQERIKEDILQKYDNFISAEDTPDFEASKISSSVKYNREDIVNTLTPYNVKEAIENENDISTLKKIRSSLNDLEGLSEQRVEDLDLKVNGRVSTRTAASEKTSVKINVISDFFRGLGYEGDSLKEKVSLFSNIISESDPIITKEDHGVLQIGDKKFQVSTSSATNGVSTFADNTNIWAVQNLNPFVDMYLKGESGSAIAKALGIQFADAAKQEDIINTIEKASREGMKPEDLKALLLANKDVSEKSIDDFIDKAYQYRSQESGERVLGRSQADIEGNVTDQTRRISNQISADSTFKTGKEGIIDPKRMFRSVDHLAKDERTGSEFDKFLDKLSVETGINNLKNNVNPDHSGTYSINGQTSLLNTVVPAERKPFITGSREAQVSSNLNSNSRTVLAANKIADKFGLPEEYSTSSFLSRTTVDRESFNSFSNVLGVSDAAIVADGASLTRRDALKDYSYTEYTKSDLYSDKSGSAILSRKYSDLIDTFTSSQYNSLDMISLPFAKEILDKKITLKDKEILEKSLLEKTENVSKAFAQRFPDVESSLSQNFNDILEEEFSNLSQRRKELLSQRNLSNKRFTYSDVKEGSLAGVLRTSLSDTGKNVQEYKDSLPIEEGSSVSRYSLRRDYYALPQNSEIKAVQSDINSLKKLQKDVRDIEVAQDKLKGVETSLTPQEYDKIYSYIDLIESSDNTSPNQKIAARTLGDALRQNPDSLSIPALEEYIKLSEFEVIPGEYIGSSANGTEIKVPDKMRAYSLKDVSLFNDEYDNKHLRFTFKGDTNLSEVGTYVKGFGVGAKENNQLLTESSFNRVSALSGLLSKGYTLQDSQDEISSWNGKALYDPNGNAVGITEVHKLISKEISNNKLKEVSVISDRKGVGLDLAASVREAYQSGEYSLLDDINVNETLRNNLKELMIREDTNLADPKYVPQGSRASSGWAMGMLATALTEGKSTADSVLGMQILGQRNLDILLDRSIKLEEQLERGVAPTTEVQRLGEESKRLLRDFFPEAFIEGSDLTDRALVEATFDYRLVSTASRFNIDNVDSIVSGQIFEKEHTDMFKLAYLNNEESLMAAHMDVSATYNYGSGSVNKTMSYNAQNHLIGNGYSLEQLRLFGQQDPKDVYDANLIMGTNKRKDPSMTLNHHFTSNSMDSNQIKNFMYTLENLNAGEIDEFLRVSGVDDKIINQDYLYYEVKSNNKEGFKTIPIPKQDTSRFGKYQIESGAEVRKPLSTSLFEVVNQDLDVQLNGSIYEPSEAFDKASANFKADLVDTVASRNNPLMKDLLALQVPNSTYSVVLPISNPTLDRLVQEGLDSEEKGMNYIGISRDRAFDLLERQGTDLQRDEKKLAKYLTGDNILQSKLADGGLADVIGFENREPSYSANSVRAVKFFVSDNLGELDNSNAIYHSSLDSHYHDLMFGDYDLDHTLIYEPAKPMTRAEYSAFEDTVHESYKGRQKLLELSEYMKIKGKDNGLYSLYDAADEAMKTLLEEEELRGQQFEDRSKAFQNYVVESQERRMQQASIKAGKRKTITPKITQISYHQNDSIDKITEIGGRQVTDTDVRTMKTMNHFLVENLIKLQHAETTASKQTPVEALINAREDFIKNRSDESKKRYRELLVSNYSDLMSDSSRPDILEQSLPYIEAMADSEVRNAVNPSITPTKVTDVSRRIGPMQRGSMDDVVDTVSGIIKGNPIVDQVSTEEVDIAGSVKTSYNNVKRNFSDNLTRNTMPLAIGGAALALGALFTQRDPDFESYSDRPVRGDIGSMLLAPNVDSIQSAKNNSHNYKNPKNPASAHILPEDLTEQVLNSMGDAVNITGSYHDFERDIHQSMKKAIFGDNISSVRIDSSYDY